MLVTPQNEIEVTDLPDEMTIRYQQMTGYRKARKDYKRMTRLDRNFVVVLNDLGTIFYLNKRPKKPIKCTSAP